MSRFIVLLLSLLLLVSCAPKKRTIIVGESVVVSGTAQYEKASINNLTYSFPIFPEMGVIPFARYDVIDTVTREVIADGTTKRDGTFEVIIDDDYLGVPLKIRVFALSDPQDALIDVRVTNHDAQGNDIYFQDGPTFIPQIDGSENLEVTAKFTGTRLAGAFNIYRQMVRGVLFVKDRVEQNLDDFPPLRVHWAVGQVGKGCTCFISGFFKPHVINIPHTDNPGDFDDVVLLHELGHYMQRSFFRDTTPGGPHFISCNVAQNLHPSLAFSEGWANAFQAIVRGEGIYVDANESRRGFSFNIESPCATHKGGQDEVAVAAAFYDAFDGTLNGVPSLDGETLQINLQQIWDAMKDLELINGRTTITSFYEALLRQGSVTRNQWDQAMTPIGLEQNMLP